MTCQETEVGGGPYVELRETHAAVVFLVGDRAYKMKKPVNLGFLDFSTEPKRASVCAREVTLNRRLAPDVYLGVADVLADAEPRPCEHLVVMRRMPDKRRLSTLVVKGAPVEDELHRLAHVIAAFHSRCERNPRIAAEGNRDMLRTRWNDSFDQVHAFHGSVLDQQVVAEVERLALRYLAGRERLFADRADRGFVVDGHGDLLADDIFCLPDGPRILDCLEFDDRLRYLDQLDDAAFLGLDLERLGAPELGARFLAWYVEFTGDPAPASLLHHYLAYRAFVRAKIGCLRHQQGDVTAAGEARALTRITHRHLATAAVALVLVGGLPGTGKSTLAGGLADELNCTLLSSDLVRKQLVGIGEEQAAAAPYGEGIYTREWTERTYAELLARTEKLLALGESVVLDASWSDRVFRAAAADLAARAYADLIALRCQAPTDLAEARLRQRRGPSDADAVIAAAMRARAHPWPEATVIETTGACEVGLRQALARVRPEPAERPWIPRRPMLEPD